ncbi:Phosphotransferase enzyme family protein [Ceratocystis lukuohia]|uniref:Phosphotransferase enzyme family protein n=2 Tax=Ceratocystis TaxID=5157 RepID=A0A0F8BKF4_CERFI|nr:Phosphotransferase enzyme family protein [Ceratocystis platani]
MSRTLPSARWTSFANWDYNHLHERLHYILGVIDKPALIRHAESIKGQKFTMSEPFSAGQNWICFEMVGQDDGSLIIARVRLPRHPDYPFPISDAEKQYALECEVSTMRYVRCRLPDIPVPEVYAYEGPASPLAASVGAVYMLIQGFYGNTLFDMYPDIRDLPNSTQRHIMRQWTSVQALLATVTDPKIGSVVSFTEHGDPVIGELANAATEGLSPRGPFVNAHDYFSAIAKAAFLRVSRVASEGDDGPELHFQRLGAYIFREIVQTTQLFRPSMPQYCFAHRNLTMHNILVDADFNFVAIIDWEGAQTVPWQANHYPHPIELYLPEEVDCILRDQHHEMHAAEHRTAITRQIYIDTLLQTETLFTTQDRELRGKFSKTLSSVASRVYSTFAGLNGFLVNDKPLVYLMVQIAFNMDAGQVREYIRQKELEMEFEAFTV